MSNYLAAVKEGAIEWFAFGNYDDAKKSALSKTINIALIAGVGLVGLGLLFHGANKWTQRVENDPTNDRAR